MKSNLIKAETKSVCPKCYEVINACVFEQEGRVFMKKACPQHGRFKTIIETDARFYRLFCNVDYLDKRLPFENLSISLTHDCNLECKVCYLFPINAESISTEYIKNRIRNFSGRMIWLTGGEPTLREDLPDIIRFVHSCNKIPVLITNGLRLANMDYVREIKKAGLQWVHFSFNGFGGDVYSRINGSGIYKIKLKALRNLKRSGVKIALSFLYVKHINDNQLKRIFSFCLENHSVIQQLRVRSVANIGKSISGESVFLSQLVERSSRLLRIDKDKIIEFILEGNKDNNAAYCTSHMPCHAEINLPLLIKRYIIINTKNEMLKKVKIILWLFKCFGLRTLLLTCIENIFNGHGKFIFSIKLRSWWDKNSIDLGELQNCISSYCSPENDNLIPFCQAIIYNEKYNNL